jgi:hypothetical protein
MPMTPARRSARVPRRSRRAQQAREGAALIIVLFILMMATGTAMFALQSTQFEQRAAGSLLQSARTKYVAESATMGVLALCDEKGVAQCADLSHQRNAFELERPKYALPKWGGVESVYQLDDQNIKVPADPSTSAFKASVVAKDADVSGGGAATAFAPSFVALMEKWEVPSPGDVRKRYRLVVSTYGALRIGAEAASTTGELRGGHESVSATRAFFDVKE